MAFRTAYTPLYRDADESGRVGTLGLLAMLQESVLGHAAALGLDHDDLVRTRGIGWMFARYRLAVARKAAVRVPVTLTTWIYAAPGARFLNNEVLVEQDGALVAAGRVESCFYDVRARAVATPEAVGLAPSALERDLGTAPVGPWRDLPADPAPLDRVRTHTVGFTDLDSFRHMTNLRYPGLVVDAFPSAVYDRLEVRDMEVHFLRQCFEGDRLDVLRADGVDASRLPALADAGLPPSVGPVPRPEPPSSSSVLVCRDGQVVAAALVAMGAPAGSVGGYNPLVSQ